MKKKGNSVYWKCITKQNCFNNPKAMCREDNWICSLTELIRPFAQWKMQNADLIGKIKHIYVLILSVTQAWRRHLSFSTSGF